ncbi:MAG TPA: DUF2339 domain-containing protein [Terriglobia bacterium]|nr:DUF2339 domain-containing protein [Terriglobia bacterium]
MPEDLIFLAVLVFLLLLWDLLRRRKRKAALQRLTERVRALEFEISSLKTLSSRLEALEKRVIANQPVGALPAMPSAKSPTASAPEAQVREGSAMPFEVGSKREEARPHAGSVIGSVPGTTGSRYRILTTVQASTVRKDLSEPGQPRATTIPAIGAAPHPYRPGIKEWIKKAINYEEIIGGNLFTKLGVIFLVFGLSLFVATQWHRLGPGMRIAIGYFVSGMMLAPGMVFERREKWRILARAAIGGGWALLYFVTYAMHHVVSPPLLASEVIDLILMLVVAAGMVLHTLKYRSQVVTGLALLLAFTTVTISHVSVYSLLAGAVLALALVIIVWRLGWYELEIFGIIAAYLNHYLWLRPIIAHVGVHHAFAEYKDSCALLIFYWAIFNISYIVRRIREKREESVSTVALLLNIGFFLGLMGYQAIYPPRTFLLFLTVGAVELALGQLPLTRRRRTAFTLLTTAGAILLVAAFPYNFSGSDLSVVWLAEGEAFVLAGIMLREIVFRWLGLCVLAVTAGQMLMVDAARVANMRWSGGPFRVEPGLAVLFGFAALILYVNAHWLTRRWRTLITDELEAGLFVIVSYLGGVLALTAVWLASSRAWMSPLWAVLMVVLLRASWRWSIPELYVQAHSIAAIAYIHALSVNLPIAAPHHLDVLRVSSVALTAALLYVGSRWAATIEGRRRLPILYRAAASSLVALLAWYELRPEYVGPAWIAFALLLMFLGRRPAYGDLQAQAHFLSGAGAASLLFVNINLGILGHFNRVQALTVGMPALMFYLISRWVVRPASARLSRIPEAYSWSGSILLALLAWRQLEPVAVAVAWAALGLLLFEIGFVQHSISLRFQGYVSFTAAFVRMMFSNLNAAGVGGRLSPRLYTMVPVAVLYFYVYGRMRGGPEDRLWRGRLKAYEYLCYLAVATLAVLVRFEFPEVWVAPAWVAMAVALLFGACITDKKIFLTQGLLLGLATLYRAVLFNLYQSSYFSTSPWQSRPLSVSTTAALLLFGLLFAFRLRTIEKEAAPESGGWAARAFSFLYRRPEQFFFLAPVALIAMLLSLDLRSGLVTLAWGVEALVIIAFALAVGERSYRLTGLGLLLLCVGKVVFVDLPRLWGTSYFYLTLIGLGSSLVAVSYLYTRYREKLRQYL